MSRTKLTLTVVAALVAAALLSSWLWHARSPTLDVVPTVVVYEQLFRREVPAEGNIRAVESTPITAPQAARLPLKLAWMVQEGKRVDAGEVVVRFDPSEIEDRLVDGRASTSQVLKKIAKERTTAGSSRRKRDREASMAEVELRAASAVDVSDRDVFSRNEIIESQIDRELASAKMAHARAAKGIERSVSAGKLDVLRVQERQAGLVVARAEKAMANLAVVAPKSGILLLRRDWRGRVLAVGDTVWPGQKIGEVPHDDELEAEVFVLEADGGALEVGLEAVVSLESKPGSRYLGVVKRVDNLAQPRIAQVPVQYFGVVLALTRTEVVAGDSASATMARDMKIGQRVAARILVHEGDAIAVPRQAVFPESGKNYVFRRRGGGFEKLEVTLGSGTAGRVVVTEGLESGDEIALRNPRQTDDAGVTVERERSRP